MGSFAQLLRRCCGGVPIFYYLRCNNFKLIIMKIKWGMMMTDGRGKLGGQVASKNRAGAYVRTKVTPVNPNTSYQSVVRQRLSSLSKEWNALTENQRLAWNEAANSGQWNKNDIFGDARRPTGKNLFTGINLVSLETTNTLLTQVPRKANFSQYTVSGATIVTDGTVTITADVAETPIIGTRWQVEGTVAVSPGRYYLKNLFRFLTATNVVSEGTANLSVGHEYAIRFGELQTIDEGKRVGLRVRQVLDGQVTPWVSVSAIVEAP